MISHLLSAKDLDRDDAVLVLDTAGEMARLPTFCHGSPATTSRTTSRSRAWRASMAATRWPMWGGSKVPPKSPIRRPPPLRTITGRREVLPRR